ncbi:hypothetical protein [Gymnodinialimonas sp.]
MLELPANLPPGALCAAHPGAVSAALKGAHWWHGSEPQMEQDPATGAVSLWRAYDGGPPAEPTEPNKGNGQIGEVDTLTGLQCRAGTHCGVVAEDAAPDATTATIAVRFYTPPGEDARTLFALNAQRVGNYVFLSETAGVLTAKDDQGRASVDLPCPDQDAPRLAVVSLFGDQLALALGPNRIDTQAKEGILQGTASLFIGCRNQRPRLLKTLGSALILDVWLFPGRALLHSDAPADTRALKALKRHHLWAAA